MMSLVSSVLYMSIGIVVGLFYKDVVGLFYKDDLLLKISKLEMHLLRILVLL